MADKRDQLAALLAALLALSHHPTDAEITAVANSLHLTISRGYAECIRREVAAIGFTATGDDLDPFVDAILRDRALTSARQVTDTFQRWRGHAAARGDDLGAWQQTWAQERTPLVDAYEEGKAGHMALRDFIRNNPGLTTTYHVEPTEAAIPDICEDLIDMGEVGAETAAENELPAHLRCPHGWEPSGSESDLSPDSVWAAGLDVH